MKNYQLLLLCFVLFITSCAKEPEDTECEDYYSANEEVITGVWDWFPYESGVHEIEYLNESGTVSILTITRSERVVEEITGPIIKCPEVSITPKILVVRGDRELFNAWADDVTLEDGKVLGTFGTSIISSGDFDAGASVRASIEDMHNTGTSVDILGTNYDDVIVFSYSIDFTPLYFIYLQKGTGILAYKEDGRVTLLKQ